MGGIGLFLLVTYHSGNYGWLVGNIFIPGMPRGLASLISKLVNLYGSGELERVHYGATTTVTLAVTGGTVICSFLAVVFTALKVRFALCAVMNAAGGTRKRNEDSEGGETLVLAARLRHYQDYLSWNFGLHIIE